MGGWEGEGGGGNGTTLCACKSAIIIGRMGPPEIIWHFYVNLSFVLLLVFLMIFWYASPKEPLWRVTTIDLWCSYYMKKKASKSSAKNVTHSVAKSWIGDSSSSSMLYKPVSRSLPPLIHQLSNSVYEFATIMVPTFTLTLSICLANDWLTCDLYSHIAILYLNLCILLSRSAARSLNGI